MNTHDQDELSGCSRRDFLKVSSIGATACAIAGMGLVRNAGAATTANVREEIVETDVLVIGGGIAGTFAAVKAKEKGLDVTLVDKGHVGRSGKSPWLGAFTVYDPARGESRESWIDRGMSSSDYIARKDYIEMWLDYSKAIREDIVSWGTVGQLNHGDVFRKQLLKNSVRLIERVMITELLVQDGQIVGAAGFPMEQDKAIVIKAKAVVDCAGTGGFKNTGFPIGPLTSDGHAMAYRVGAEISGKELTDAHHVPFENVSSVWSKRRIEQMSIERIDPDKCIGCGTCVATCPMDVIRMDAGTEEAKITYPDDCQICHLCKTYCPVEAISISPVKCVRPMVGWG